MLRVKDPQPLAREELASRRVIEESRPVFCMGLGDKHNRRGRLQRLGEGEMGRWRYVGRATEAIVRT